MRSYGQFCALAKALDVVGDRWTLLIVRELLIHRSCRYTDLQEGLPGVATNLLAGRLRDLERAGVVTRDYAGPPIATTLVRLTDRGRALEPVLQALGHWGAPLLATSGRRDAFRVHWLSLPLEHHLTDRAPKRPPVAIELRTGQEPMTLQTVDGAVRARRGPADDPDGILTGTPQLVLGVLTGTVSLATARAGGLRYQGDPAALRRIGRGTDKARRR